MVPPSGPSSFGQASASYSGSDLQDSEMFHSATSEHLAQTLVQLSPQEVARDTTSSASGQLGVAIMELATIQAFLVSGFRGDLNRDYVCAWVSDVCRGSSVAGKCAWLGNVLGKVYMVDRVHACMAGTCTGEGVYIIL